MMYGIIAVALIFVFANLPQYIRKQLTEKIADESSKAKENLQTSQLNFLTKIEWLKFYPLKKILLGVIWLVCLFYAVRGVFMTINDPRGVFIFLTVLFWLITIFTARKIWRYIKLSYHCVPVLNHIKTKEELKESLQGECFEKVLFEHNILRKYFPVLISENWVVMNGRLFPRHGVEKIYYLHESPVWNYEQIRFIYSNGEEYLTPSDRQTVDELRQTEISNLLHKICPVVIEKAEDINTTSNKKDKSIIYWKMNYKGKFRRTLWMIPFVIILCILLPLCLGSSWIIYDIIMIAILIWQLWYTYKKMKLEERTSNEIDENNNKKYTIAMKNIHMYNYLLAIKDETHIYKAIIEAVPDENNYMMIWLDDFNFPQTEIEDIKKEIELYFKAKSINCIFKAGKRV